MGKVIHVNFGRNPDPLVGDEPPGWHEFLASVQSELVDDDVQDLLAAIQNSHAFAHSDEVIQTLAHAYFLSQGLI